ncbi:MAG: putative collagen-binding domain-containing protein, partial [Vicinamibacterales bacterium]|nr:putative collagen-binding domain-containing protein [Vicinamibacterales bacterium]
GKGFFWPRSYWKKALDDPGAGQMRYLRELILSRSYFDRVPDQSLVAGDNGERYERVIATRGINYAFLYTYTGRAFDVVGGKIAGDKVTATWMNPRNGEKTVIGDFKNTGVLHFQPPGKHENGNDWVLILDSK